MRLFRKIFVWTTAIFTLLIAAVSYITISRNLAELRSKALKDGAAMVENIVPALESGAQGYSWPFESLNRLTKGDGFAFWWIISPSGTIELSDRTGFMNTKARAYFPGASVPRPGQTMFYSEDSRRLLVAMRRLEVRGEPWEFWYGFSTERIFLEVRRELARRLAFFLFCFAVFVGGAYFVTRHYLAPVSSLIDGARRIGGGDLSYRISVPSGDELGELAAAFNEMAASLRERRDSLRNSVQRFRDLAESISDAVWECGADLELSYVSPRIKDICGLPESAFLGKGLESMFCGSCQGGLEDLRALLTGASSKRGPIPAVEREVLLPDGRALFLELNGLPYYGAEGDFLGYRGVLRDITGRKKAEEERRGYTVRLEATVKERTAQLESANEELQAFNYSVSHDLRGPLNRIMALGYMLEKDSGSSLTEEGVSYLKKIRKNCERMGGIIADLLKLSRVTHCELRNEEVDLAAMANDVFLKLSESDASCKAAFKSPPGPLSAFADAGLMREVLENLIGNAVKFTGRTENPLIEFGAVEKGGERVFFVKDNGAGFEPDLAGELFKPFKRLHSYEDFPGTGIGLNIVSRIMARHGGRIWAEGAAGKGATFHFTLARRDAPGGLGKKA